MSRTGWKALGASVRGASHRRNGSPNQDAISWVERDDDLAAAVADGHGSSLSFRSDVGAAFAVGVAMQASHASSDEPLPSAVVRAWRSLVERDLTRHPFSDDELQRLAEERGPDDLEAVRTDPFLAYGATLLFALATDREVSLWQIGDGDIVVVRETDGAPVVTRPVPPDDRLVGNVTTSLCGANAAGDFRHASVPVAPGERMTLMLTTDGYANSFVDDQAFLKVGVDVQRMLADQGPAWVGGNLRGWLQDASERGSGDDISAVVVFSRPSAPGAEEGGTEPIPTGVPGDAPIRGRSVLPLIGVAAMALLIGAGVGRTTASGGGPTASRTATITPSFASSVSPSISPSVSYSERPAPGTISPSVSPSAAPGKAVVCGDLGPLRGACQDAVGSASIAQAERSGTTWWIVTDTGKLFRMRAASAGADPVQVHDFILSVAVEPTEVIATGQHARWSVDPASLVPTQLAG